ncbi:hypothetical protein NPX13_g8752 [Xylaria arbuscula]|uniref:Solute carrier family 25 member 38 homolog n=1 Tax=Xylaria arbuscula TaxID=114810 RepID=A0A9W8N804_9PEZI|nr:hypothetical protein NPX13_g8752 [Xylaria arbuscula]
MSQQRGQSSKSSSSFHFVAGLGSGISGAVLLQPFDLLKTRVQQSGTHSIRSAIREIASSPNAIAAFWRGTVPSALRTGMGSAIYFTTLNTIRQQASALQNQKQHDRPSSSALPKLSNTTNLLSGAFARAFAGFILMPLTVIKVRYESSMYSYASVIGAAATSTEQIASQASSQGSAQRPCEMRPMLASTSSHMSNSRNVWARYTAPAKTTTTTYPEPVWLDPHPVAATCVPQHVPCLPDDGNTRGRALPLRRPRVTHDAQGP